jgi:hypothetical protein
LSYIRCSLIAIVDISVELELERSIRYCITVGSGIDYSLRIMVSRQPHCAGCGKVSATELDPESGRLNYGALPPLQTVAQKVFVTGYVLI